MKQAFFLINKGFFVGMVLTLCLATNTLFAEESLGDFMQRIDKMTAPVDQMMNAYAACASGNDNACVYAHVDPRDPCRRYLTSAVDLHACHAQQLDIGSQQNRTNQNYSQPAPTFQRSQAHAAEVNCNSDCSRSWVNCQRACGFGVSEDRSRCNNECLSDHNHCKSGCR